MQMIKAFTLLLALAANCDAFTVTNTHVRFGKATISTSSQLEALLSIDLEKPLGIVLEEMEENAPKGVKVEELSDAGSAYASEYRNQLIGLKIAQVGETDVTNMAFDDVMECIINSASPVNISFEVPDEPAEPAIKQFNMGTAVQIKVIQEGNPDVTLDAKVGDNLRKTLLENKVELYRGLKKKLGNCGGQGQCTFCAVDFVEGEGWQERSDYENKKIAKLPPNARLACMNNIQGPATIRIQ
jgi:ferredoxin